MKNDLIIFGAKYLFLVSVLITFFVFFKLNGRRRWQFLIAMIMAGLASVIFVKLLGKLYFHPRPFVLEHIKPLVAHGADNGFPSEHATYTAAIASVLYFYKEKLGIAAFIIAVLVGFSRVLAHVHSPIDVLAGLAIGIIAGAAGYF